MQIIDIADRLFEPSDAKLQTLLARLPKEERASWLAEVCRLSRLIERYQAVQPKRQPGTKDFVPAVYELCTEAACSNSVVLAREPRRAKARSPYAMNRWIRAYRREGSAYFLLPKKCFPQSSHAGRPLRYLSSEVTEWMNANWRRFRKARHLYRALVAQAAIQGWDVPSETWISRRWKQMPEILKATKFSGGLAHKSGLAPHFTQDYRSLEALQVLCGDHSERHVIVRLRNGTLCRPWLTVWCDLRTEFIWGWYLDLAPSPQSAGLAYADGVMRFGAQPPSRPTDGYLSYVYANPQRDYRSHNCDGKVMAVHGQAMRLDGGLEFLRLERKVGILNELAFRQLMPRSGNQPLQAFFRAIANWEQNTFPESCARIPNARPEQWRRLYARHERALRDKAIEDSPFPSFETYRQALEGFIQEYNSSPHERLTSGSDPVVPLEEYCRLYTTTFAIAPETLALLLMKSAKRVIRKNGVQCFKKHFFFFNEAMATFKGHVTEVLFSEREQSRVWVVLPNQRICEARLIRPTPLLNPDPQTLAAVAQARAYERRLIRDYTLIPETHMRGEAIEKCVASALPAASQREMPVFPQIDEWSAPALPQSRVHQLTRLDRQKLRAVPDKRYVTAADVANAEGEVVISESWRNQVIEFDYQKEDDN